MALHHFRRSASLANLGGFCGVGTLFCVFTSLNSFWLEAVTVGLGSVSVAGVSAGTAAGGGLSCFMGLGLGDSAATTSFGCAIITGCVASDDDSTTPRPHVEAATAASVAAPTAPPITSLF